MVLEDGINGDWTEAAEVMRFLIDSGADADVNKRDAGGNMVLHLAVREPAMLAMLLKTVGGAGGLDTSAVNNGGWTAHGSRRWLLRVDDRSSNEGRS